jgi:hypothetical protein
VDPTSQTPLPYKASKLVAKCHVYLDQLPTKEKGFESTKAKKKMQS